MTASRRTVLKVAGFAAAGLVSGLLPGLGGARAAVPARHAFATIGEPKRGPGFGHFDHADPAAPKGGTVRLWFNGSFDSLHPFILKGIPAAGSNPFLAGGSLITFESLMLEAADESGVFSIVGAAFVTFTPEASEAGEVEAIQITVGGAPRLRLVRREG